MIFQKYEHNKKKYHILTRAGLVVPTITGPGFDTHNGQLDNK